MLGPQPPASGTGVETVAISPGTPRSVANVASGVILALALLVFAYQGLIDSETGGLREIQDHVITISLGEQAVQSGEYFRDFGYPLPAVVMKLGLAALGRPASSVVWMGLMIGSALAVAGAFVLLLGLRESDRAGLPVLIAFAAVVYCVQWDFEAMNSNIVFLALALWSLVLGQRGRPGAAGFLLASSIALKLYSVALLPYLLLAGRWREGVWTGVWLVFYFAGVPVLYLGAADAVQLTASWIRTVAATSDPEFIFDLIGYKVSLYHVLLGLLGERAAGQPGNLASLPVSSVHALTRAVQLVWLGGVAGYLVWERRRPCSLAAGTRELINAGLLLLAMLLLSPLLQPHHGVVLLVPAVVLAHVALDRGQPGWLRGSVAALLAASAPGLDLAPSGLAKGVMINASIVAFSLGVVLVRVAAGDQSSPGISSWRRSTAS